MRGRITLPRFAILSGLCLAGTLALFTIGPSEAQRSIEAPAPPASDETRELRRALQSAQAAAAGAGARSERLSVEAESATAAEERARIEVARLAARLQEAEAEANLAEARLAVIERRRRALDRRLATQREPLVRLTAALQRLGAQPLALSALQPASIEDAVHLRAVLNHAVPAIQARTAGLRAELEQSRRLAGQARLMLQDLRRAEETIAARRTALLAEAARYRQAFASASGAARREARRAEDMALEARNLGELVTGFDRMARQRAELAALPGPVMRPAGDGAGGAAAPPPPPVVAPPSVASSLRGYRLPVVGRITGGFGDAEPGGLRRTGLTLEPRAGALAVAPAAGRIAFAGPYRGFGGIVIIEHGGGWTSLVTGLGALDVAVGQQVGAGGPLGTAPGRQPAVTLELRRDGEPVDPLPFALRQGD